jgi:hypothetical protein
MMNPRERDLLDLLAAQTAGIKLPHNECNFPAPTAPLSRRRIMDRRSARLPTTPRGDNRSSLPLPLTNTERNSAPRLNVFDQALVPETTQSLFEPVPVPPPPPDLYPLLARGPTISAIHVRNGAASARTNASCASGSGQHVQSFREASSNGNSAAGADVVSPRTDVCDIEGTLAAHKMSSRPLTSMNTTQMVR